MKACVQCDESDEFIDTKAQSQIGSKPVSEQAIPSGKPSLSSLSSLLEDISTDDFQGAGDSDE